MENRPKRDEIDTNLIENYMRREINSQIQIEKSQQNQKENNQNDQKENFVYNPELQNYYTENIFYDYVYPFCLFVHSKEKIPNTDIYFRMNFRYLHKLR